jgi:hypothetical protein
MAKTRKKKQTAKQIERKAILKKLRAFTRRESSYDKPCLNKLAKLIEQGRQKDAYACYRDMDTFVRDGVPEEVIQFISLNRKVGKRIVRAQVKLVGNGSKKVFNPKLGAGVIYECTLEYPGDMTDAEVSVCANSMHNEILREIVTVELKEKVKT